MCRSTKGTRDVQCNGTQCGEVRDFYDKQHEGVSHGRRESGQNILELYFNFGVP